MSEANENEDTDNVVPITQARHLRLIGRAIEADAEAAQRIGAKPIIAFYEEALSEGTNDGEIVNRTIRKIRFHDDVEHRLNVGVFGDDNR